MTFGQLINVLGDCVAQAATHNPALETNSLADRAIAGAPILISDLSTEVLQQLVNAPHAALKADILGMAHAVREGRVTVDCFGDVKYHR